MAPASLCQDPGAYVSVVCVLLFRFVSFSWRMIAFQCPAGFCPLSAWISHRPSWRSSRPPRSGPSPRPGRAPRLTRCTPSRAVSPRRRTCLCCSPHASPPPSQRPQVCSLHLHCCPANRLIACSRCVCVCDVCGVCVIFMRHSPPVTGCGECRSIHGSRRGQDPGLDPLTAPTRGLRCSNPRPSNGSSTCRK